MKISLKNIGHILTILNFLAVMSCLYFYQKKTNTQTVIEKNPPVKFMRFTPSQAR